MNKSEIIEYSDISIKLTKKISSQVKKNNGIYFSPQSHIQLIVDYILNYMNENKLNYNKILEPSCGSCEIIKYLNEKISNVNITGVEYNTDIYKMIETINFGKKNDIKLFHHDFLTFEQDKYNLIIGNPPYYVIPKKNINSKYLKYLDGRPNIYTIFIIRCMEQLLPNGILAFFIPKNFLNCLYYDKLREYIHNKYKIINIMNLVEGKYLDTEQEIICLILMNCKGDNSIFSYKIGNNYIFNNKLDEIKKLLLHSTTLDQRGFKVSIGTVVWNQHKNHPTTPLTTDSTMTRLIYNSDIVDNVLIMKKYKNIEKHNYINKQGKTDLILVLNRGYGKGEYKFNYCIVDIKEPYLIENHLICITYKKKISRKKLLKLYQEITSSFQDKRTGDFVKLYFGNNAINSMELQSILPIYNII